MSVPSAPLVRRFELRGLLTPGFVFGHGSYDCTRGLASEVVHFSNQLTEIGELLLQLASRRGIGDGLLT